MNFHKKSGDNSSNSLDEAITDDRVEGDHRDNGRYSFVDDTFQMSKIEPSKSKKSDNKTFMRSEATYSNEEVGLVIEKKLGFFKRFIDGFRTGTITTSRMDPITGCVIVDDDKAVIRNLDEIDENGGLMKRKLKSRHIQMIAIGGAIGTGLFVGSGKALANGGPASVLLAFLLVSIMLYCTISSLTELAVAFPIQGSFSVYSTRFIDPAWGFAMGWNFAIQWLISLPLELVAAGIVMHYWNIKINTGIFIMIFYLILLCINIFGVQGYGESEFIFCTVKVISVIMFMLLSLVIVCGGSPNKIVHGMDTWRDPGAFAHGFAGFASVFVTAAFSFSGTELVGLAVGETDNPRKTIPKVTKVIVWRILFFYIINLFLIGLIIPWNDEKLFGGTSAYDAKASPFVIAIKDAGISVLPDIFNVVILVAVLSVGNAAVYSSSRTITALAGQGQAPKIFKYIDRKGRPTAAVGAAFLFGLIAFVQLFPGGQGIFDWLSALSGLSSLITWASINFAYIKFHKALVYQGGNKSELAYRSSIGLPGAWLGAILNVLAIFGQLYVSIHPPTGKASITAFFKGFLTIPVAFAFYAVWKLIHWNSQSYMTSEKIDLHTGRRNFDLEVIKRMDAEEKANSSFFKSVSRIFT